MPAARPPARAGAGQQELSDPAISPAQDREEKDEVRPDRGDGQRATEKSGARP